MAEKKVLRGYELHESIGAGGFGAVYRAFQPILNREVAIKLILPAYANQLDFIRRFETEAQIIARLEHPHIVPLFDYWRDPNGAYLVMRWIRGGSLSRALRQDGAFSVTDTMKMLDEIGGALTIAHRAGVVHRDIKPDNILLDEDGNAYLTDFGIAQSITRKPSEDDSESITGSFQYIPPEQLTGTGVMPQSDIYTLAFVAYETLTGEMVYKSESISELITKQMYEPIPNICQKINVPPAFNEVLQKATAKEPTERFTTVREFINALNGALDPTLTPDIVSESDIVNPYKGLRSFEQFDAEDFFGREAFTQKLTNRLNENEPFARFLAVVGPSGSGKSSVVKAGLLPQIRRMSMAKKSWFIAEMVPGDAPLRRLEDVLVSLAHQPPSHLADLLNHDANGLTQAVQSIMHDDNYEVVLFIDQFEEVFTLCHDEAERAQFLRLIQQVVTDPHSQVRVVVTLRADFYDRPLLYDGIGELMQARTEVVLPLSANDIERAITEPAKRAGLKVDADLVAQIVADVKDEPGTLPLLQYTLTILYDKREGRRLTLKAYQETGGVLGALAQQAEEVFTTLRPDQRALAQQLFIRLVTLGDSNEDTRRRALRRELLALGNTEAINTLLDVHFGQARLLTFDRERGTGEPTVEIAHEALIRNWTRLHDWLDDSREDIRLQRQLAANIVEWQNKGKKSEFLLSGGRLAQYEEWQNEVLVTLTPTERAFIADSIQERNAKRARDEAIARRVKRAERATLGLVVVGFLALGLAIFAGVSLQQANDQAATVYPRATFFSMEQQYISTLADGGALIPFGTFTPEMFYPTLTGVANLRQWNPDDPNNLRVDDYGVEMVRVPAGCFMMGSIVSSDEEPVHEICFANDFWIDRFEVTNEQFERIGNTIEAEERIADKYGDANLPRGNVMWDEALAFCEQREARLPTEPEWEYAARGANSYIYPWGNTFPSIKDSVDYTVYFFNSGEADGEGLGRPGIVGETYRAKGRSWVGAYDMVGNIYEWTSTIGETYEVVNDESVTVQNFLYPYYANDGREELEPEYDALRIMRGGPFVYADTDMRADLRYAEDQYWTEYFYGFRCAKSDEQ